MAAVPRFARRLGWRSLRAVVGSNDPRAASFWRALSKDLAYAMAAHNIWKPITCAHFIAQIAEESAAFKATEEFASGAEYEGRRDLGNTHSGDGKRYKGRSFIMVTGRTNYRALPHWDGINFELHPERLSERKYACLAAAHWWENAGLNGVAVDGSDATVVKITEKINGGTNGIATRRLYFRRAYNVRKFLTPSRRPPS